MCVFGSPSEHSTARLHNQECLSIDPQAEEELSGAENKQRVRRGNVSPPAGHAQCPCEVYLYRGDGPRSCHGSPSNTAVMEVH